MALSQIYTAVAGHIITAARWNNEFGNIYTNGVDLAFPLTKAVSFAGFTISLDVSGVSTLTSPSTTGFLFTVGNKSGAPSASGSLGTFSASTFTDSTTAASGTAALWSGFSVRQPTLAASSALVTTTDACTVYIQGAPTAGTNQTLTEGGWALLANGNVKITGNLRVRTSDTRTATVEQPFTVQLSTSGIPAAGIGTGITLRAKSADEDPSNLCNINGIFTDITAGSEDSVVTLDLRTAGVAVSEAYRFARTSGQFSAILTHANTAARTYTLPDRDMLLGGGALYVGPASTGTGSTRAHEGAVTISSNQNPYDGVHYFSDFTLDPAKTLTLGAATHRLIIVATGTITINGTIDATGAGSTGGGATAKGSAGNTQPGGGGGSTAGSVAGGAGGDIFMHSVSVQVGGTAGTGVSGSGGSATQKSGTAANYDYPWNMMGGAGGGGAGASGLGGPGGGSIILIAPRVVLGAASVLKTSGNPGTTPGVGPGGGGGGSGNILIICQSYTDSGCTFTLTGGLGSAANTSGGNGGNGADGVKQINIYA